jgi:8-oxo-dGTP diphosphatase
MSNKIVVAVKGILIKDGKALMVKRADDDEIGSGRWEFSGGKLEFGESPEAALRREFLEETGLCVEVGKLLYVTSFKTDPSRQVILIAYLCDCDDCHAVTLSDEHSDYMWASRAEVRAYLAEDIADDISANDLWEIFPEN